MSPRKRAAAAAGASENDGPEPRYADLMEELERILEDLDSDAVDVDELGARVKRGSELIRLCRERLLKSRTEIEQVVAELETLDPASEETTRDPSDADSV